METEKYFGDLINKYYNYVIMLVVYLTVLGSNPGGGEIFRTLDRLWGPPNPQYSGYRVSFSGGKGGVLLTTHSHLEPRLKK
jgi:hypothetical protein